MHPRADTVRAAACGLALALACDAALGQAPRPAAPAGTPVLSTTAERVYAAARPRLLQIRTLLQTAGRQSSIGSGFLVSADGLAVTNYHVVSQYVLEPGTYRLEYAAPDGARGALKVLAIDVANDLAAVRLEGTRLAHFDFDGAALKGALPKGERLYAMGNPLDLGFTIVEGTYNGLVERSYNERVHLSGALNPGMSGGPTVTAEGRVAGVNVAKRLGGELVSFLVPARFAAALVARAAAAADFSPEGARAEIERQLSAWQDRFYREILDRGFRDSVFGPYRAPESAAPWFTCWARTNADEIPRPRATLNTTQCTTDTGIFVAGDLQTGGVGIAHSYARSAGLNAFQFAAFVSAQYRVPQGARGNRKRFTREFCHENFYAGAGAAVAPPLRAVWCARAYRDFANLYDVSLVALTQDRDDEALISRLSLQTISYSNALELTRRFLGALRWAK
ncbi:MAG: trypsin-like peptidase domain-containing protein [Burkholderiales bacterium]|nr:trypsin-like peptidase domain-containing protein [Burkholderiales bacterium]